MRVMMTTTISAITIPMRRHSATPTQIPTIASVESPPSPSISALIISLVSS